MASSRLYRSLILLAIAAAFSSSFYILTPSIKLPTRRTFLKSYQLLTSLASSNSDVIDVDVLYDYPDELIQSKRENSRVNDRNQEKMQRDLASLIKDIRSVVRQTGGRVGFQRTLTAVRALFTTSREVLRDVDFFSTGVTNLSIKDYAKYLRMFFERMGATYIKVGQFIASSPTLFPGEFVLEMQKCLDATEPVPFTTIMRIIKEELGANSISTYFLYIDPKPLACASIAQVHRAKLVSGEEVVLKVQKPGTDGVLKTDLGFLYIATRVLELLQPELARISLSAIVGDIRSSMLDELDFIKEADNIDEFRNFLKNSEITDATAPRVYRNLTTSKVLTMERLKGVSLTDLEAIKKFSLNPEATLISALNTWSLSVMMCESFHADVHAGNLLVLEDGRVGFIDFGIVGRIPKKIWGSIQDLSESIVSLDYIGMANALVQMGATDGKVDIQQFAFDIEAIFEKIDRLNKDVRVVATSDESTGTARINAVLNIQQEDITQVLIDIAATAEQNGLKLPREFGLLIKQALYFDVYSSILAPQVDILRDSRIVLPNSSPDSNM